MARLAGVDGCKAGWFTLTENTDAGFVEAFVAPTFAALAGALDGFDVIAVDIPVGLSIRGARACDLNARRLLGRRRASSVFPAPIRATLNAQTHAEASAIRRHVEGKGMSIQAFAILSKVAEVDEYVGAKGQKATRIFEVHPEMSFMALGGQRPMRYPKKTRLGRNERRETLLDVFPADTINRVRAASDRKQLAHDDVLDALACLWSARRIASGQAMRVPIALEQDEKGRDVAIWF